MTRYVLAIVAASCGAIAVAAPPPKAGPKKDLYYPVQVGAKWVYDYSGHDTTIVVSKVETEDKGTLVTCDYVSAEGKQAPCHKYRVSQAGIWMTEEVGEKYEPAWQLFKAPFKAEDKWEFATRRRDLRISGTFVLAAEEEVTVPAGKYKAIKVTSPDYKIDGGPGATEASWYAVGVGEVKREGEAGKPIRTLKAFTPGK